MFKSKEAQKVEEVKRRDYLKQQELLRNMSKPKHNLSADAMIENLLSKKEIFQKKAPQNDKTRTRQNQVGDAVPGLYLCVWQWCRLERSSGGAEALCDTAKLSSLLMTSRLSTQTLGYIWSLANRTVPGSLTQQELYVTLALVALAQSGYSFRSAAVIEQLGRYPVPALDMSLVERERGCVPAAPLTTPASEEEDEFDDFKSADLTGLSVDSLKVLELTSCTPQSSLIRFDSPKRPVGVLSLVESPAKSPPTQLSVLDLPLTDSSHQPPFCTLPAPSPSPDNPPDKVAVDSIKSISGGVCDSPQQPVEDLFPKCSVSARSEVGRGGELLDWMGGGEEYMTCDLTTHAVTITAHPPVTPRIIPNPLMDSFSDPSSPEPELEHSNSCPDSVSVDSLRLEDTPPLPATPQVHPPPASSSSDKCWDTGVKLPSLDFDSSRTPSPPPSQPPHLNNTRPNTTHIFGDSSLNIDNTPSVVECSGESKSVGLLDFEDKYSALRSLNAAENQSGDDFGDFMAAEPVSYLEASPPHSHPPQPNIQDECIEACLKLLNQAIASYSSVSNDKVLNEILDHQRSKKYLEELGEVYKVCERLVRGRGREEEKGELEAVWTRLGCVTRQATPQIKTEASSDEGVRCGVCLLRCKADSQVSYAMNHFHSTCASLYLHNVANSSLPLRPL